MIRFITTEASCLSKRAFPLGFSFLSTHFADLIKSQYINVCTWNVVLSHTISIPRQYLRSSTFSFLYDLNTPLTVDEVIEKDIITNYDVEMSQMAKFPVFYHQTSESFWSILTPSFL